MNCGFKYGTIGQMIIDQAAELGEKRFLTEAETGREYTYGEIDAAANEVAATLADRGVAPGDKVAAVLDNDATIVIALAGIQKRGAVAVPINPEYTAAEIEYILDQSDSTLAIANRNTADRVESAGESTAVETILGTDESGENPYFRDKTEYSGTAEEVVPTDTAVIMFTSGTTGDPKGVALSHANLLMRYAGRSRGDHTFYTILPLYNTDGWNTTFGTMYRGGENVLRDGFSASSFWDDVDRYGLNMTSAVPSILAILLEIDYPEDRDISSMETIYVSGAYVSPELVEEFEATFGIDALEIYGLTEATGTSFASAEERVLGSCGRPNRFVELTVRDPETGADLPAGKNGEIMIRGPAVFKEYHGDPDATREAFDGQWLHTGDIGYYDEGDRYYIIDRMKNVIIRGGQNIYPGEIEDVIREHTAVKDVAIVGVDHEIYGEIPKAYVMVTEDREPGETLAEEIKSLGQERLVEYKVPGEIEFLERFPRGETGKILREEL